MKNMPEKRAQGDVIVTVLLILIGIAAVAIVSVFVINLVKNNLASTDCLNIAGQLKINSDESLTFYDVSEKNLSVNVERGTKEFNLSSINFIFGTDESTKSLDYMDNLDKIYFYDLSLPGWINTHMGIPQPGETITYKINLSPYNLISVTVVSIVPVINNKLCDEADRKEVKTFS